MNDASRSARMPLFVAYYRRTLPRFLKVRQLLEGGGIGTVTAVQATVSDRLAALSMS
jgi:predicted dehydrogenase